MQTNLASSSKEKDHSFEWSFLFLHCMLSRPKPIGVFLHYAIQTATHPIVTPLSYNQDGGNQISISLYLLSYLIKMWYYGCNIYSPEFYYISGGCGSAQLEAVYQLRRGNQLLNRSDIGLHGYQCTERNGSGIGWQHRCQVRN